MRVLRIHNCNVTFIGVLMLVAGCETTPLQSSVQSNAKLLDIVSSEQEIETATLEFQDIPSMTTFISADTKPATIDELKAQLNELDSIVPDTPSTAFPNFEASKGLLVYNNVAGKYVFDIDQQDRAGIIFSDGIKAPSYVFLNDNTTFLQEFVTYFSIKSKTKFEKYIQQRADKRHRDAMRKSKAEQPMQSVLNKIKTDYLPKVTSDEAALINKVVLDRFDFIYGYAFNQEYFSGDFRNFSVEVVEGNWKGRTYSFKRNDQGQRISSQNIIYDGTNTTNTNISYRANGLIEKIASSNYRSKLDSTSNTALYAYWESDHRVLIYRFPTQLDSPVYWDDMKSIVVESYDFDAQYKPTKHEVYKYNGVTGDFGVSDFGWVWEYKPDQVIQTNLRDGKPFDKRVSKYRDGLISEDVFEGLGYDYYRKDITSNAVTKSFSKDNKLMSTLERTLNSKGCINEIIKSEEGKVVEVLKFACD